jgi:hypothetical protein
LAVAGGPFAAALCVHPDITPICGWTARSQQDAFLGKAGPKEDRPWAKMVVMIGGRGAAAGISSLFSAAPRRHGRSRRASRLRPDTLQRDDRIRWSDGRRSFFWPGDRVDACEQ